LNKLAALYIRMKQPSQKALQTIQMTGRVLFNSFETINFANEIQLIETSSIAQKELKDTKYTKELYISGIAPADTPDHIYIADAFNGKVKRVNIKTRLFDKAH